MRSRLTCSFAIVLAAALCATSAFAIGLPGMGGMGGATHQRWFVVGVGGGVAVPVSDAKDALENGWNGVAYARLQPPGLPISFGVSAAFQRFNFKDVEVTDQSGAVSSVSPGTADMLAGLGDLKFDLGHGAIHPYLTAGVGAYSVKTDLTAVQYGETSKVHFGINGGAGLALQFGAVSAFVQGRVDNVYTDIRGFTTANAIQVIPVTAGIEF